MSLSSDVSMVLMRFRMRRDLVMSMNVIEFEFLSVTWLIPVYACMSLIMSWK